MTRPIDESHDPALRSWVESANRADCDFPVQNLPFGVFERRGILEQPRIGVAIGDQVLDLARCAELGLLEELPADIRAACAEPALNALCALGAAASARLRHQLIRLLRADASRAEPAALVPMDEAELKVPARIGNYTDFYASIFHATHVGRFFRPDNPLMPNYKYVPIAYHGRASSIVASGTPVQRPWGQIKPAAESLPSFQPSRMLDYEVEIGVLIGSGNDLGHPIPLDEADDHVFGLCLLNDWSARDIQAWEYQPLGPFLAKSFATTVTPWIVTLDALAPYRGPAFRRDAGDPPPLPYLYSLQNAEQGGIDVTVEAMIRSARMREEGLSPLRLSRSTLREMYWTIPQMLAHHTSNGCNLLSGDLLGSGTVSGERNDALGCLLEITRQGSQPIALPTAEQRTYLEDGDEVIFNGCCMREGFARLGFGTCSGTILPAVR
jgi:fumarylacetoacetase